MQALHGQWPLHLGVVIYLPTQNKSYCRSKTIQSLPPYLFTLMKSTEPWSDEYYQMDVEEAVRQAGFKHVVTQESDHRHRAVLGIKA